MLKSAIVVPSSRLAVPSRPVIRPGWDDLPIDRLRRRSALWRRLLSGRAGITRFQPGTCCGCGSTCQGCTFPSTVTLSWTAYNAGAACGIGGTVPGDGSATLVTFQTFPCQNIITACNCAACSSWAVALFCFGGNITLALQPSCPGGPGECDLTPTSISCDPLLITYDIPPTSTCYHVAWTSFTVSP